jgi:arylsulfatase A-like enzyme
MMLFLAACAKKNEEPAARTFSPLPNIVLIFADDLGYGDLGCYGATKVQTPNMDRLARQGRVFTDAHSASAVCSPSRYGLLTGQYPLRRNFWGPISVGTELTIDSDQMTIARLLKEAGYATAIIGKWHLGFGEGETDWNGLLKPGPLELGFDYFYGIPQVNSGPPFVYVENHRVVGFDPADPFVYGIESVTQKWPAKSGYSRIGGAKEAHLLYRDEELGTTFRNKAIDWMKETYRQDKDRPFFLYLATTNIHHPFTPAPRFKGTSDCGRYGDFIHELDWIVGDIITALDDMGITKNTLVILTSDNGGMLNNGGQDAWRAGHRLNGDLLGFKFGAWEGGHRIPLIVRWPGKVPENTKSAQLICHVDFLATFSTILDQPLQETVIHDSVNQLPALLGNPEAILRNELIVSPNSPEHLLARRGNWVYIPAQDEGGFRQKNVGDHTFGGAAVLSFTGQVNSDIVNGEVRSDAPPAQLYNLLTDPRQTNNVYAQYPEIVEEMQKLLNGYHQQISSIPQLGWIDRP